MGRSAEEGRGRRLNCRSTSRPTGRIKGTPCRYHISGGQQGATCRGCRGRLSSWKSHARMARHDGRGAMCSPGGIALRSRDRAGRGGALLSIDGIYPRLAGSSQDHAQRSLMERFRTEHGDKRIGKLERRHVQAYVSDLARRRSSATCCARCATSCGSALAPASSQPIPLRA